jgi:hypothetical protein
MIELEKLLELQRKTITLQLPYTNAMTIYAALFINAEIPTAPLNRSKVQEVWDTDLYRTVKERLNALKEDLVIDVSMAVELARRIFITRCTVAADPFYALFECCNFDDWRGAVDNLPEHIQNRVFLFVFEGMERYRAQFSALALQDKKIEASNRLANEVIESIYNQFVDTVQEVNNSFYPLVLEMIEKMILSLVRSVHAIAHPEQMVLMEPSMAKDAALFIFDSLYNNKEVAAILTERLLDIDGFADKFIQKENVYSSPMLLAMETFDNIDAAFDVVDMQHAEFRNTLQDWGLKTLTPADLKLLQSKFPEIIADSDIDLDSAVSTEGIISSIKSGARTVIRGIIRMIIDFLNGILKYLGMPFGLEPKFILTESGKLIETWGERYNRPIHDYLETTPAWLLNERTMLDMMREAKGIAISADLLIAKTHREIKKAMADDNPSAAQTEMYSAITEVINLRKQFERLPGTYKILEGKVDFTIDYAEPPTDQYRTAPVVGLEIAKRTSETFRNLNAVGVNKRAVTEAQIRNVQSYPKEAKYDGAKGQMENVVDDLRDMVRKLEDNARPIDMIKMGKMADKNTVMLDRIQTLHNEFAEYTTKLVGYISQAMLIYTKVYTDCSRLALEMKLTADTNFVE